MALLGTAGKQPSEVESYTVAYHEDVKRGDELAVEGIVIHPGTGENPPVIDGYFIDQEAQRVRFFVSGGVDRTRHKIEITVSTASGRVLQDEIILAIRDF